MMKRLKEKFGNRMAKTGEERVTHRAIQITLSFVLLFAFAACQKAWYGRDGRPGDTFLTLTWIVSEPSYINAGTNAIPYVFEYGRYYKIFPGYYNLYYEGRVFTGMYWANYAWEITYEIWEVPGEPGSWYYNGARGPDNFFTIEMSPHGPYIFSQYKSGEVDESYELIEESENQIILLQKGDGMNMKITYTRVEPINFGTDDETGRE